MHCIDDKPNGIILNHNGDWSGRVRLVWYVASDRRDPGPTPASMRECWCDGPDLVAGLFTPTSGPPSEPSLEPPVNVITRAVALAVESYLCRKMESALEGVCIRRGKL